MDAVAEEVRDVCSKKAESGETACGTWGWSVSGKTQSAEGGLNRPVWQEQVNQSKGSWEMNSEVWGRGREGVADHVHVCSVPQDFDFSL